MCLKILPKNDLVEEQLKYINKLIEAHRDDAGPPNVWNVYKQGLYAAIDESSKKPIGLIEASGTLEAVSPGWWLDSRVRGMGYGNKLVDALAAFLKELGYTGVGKVTIQTTGGVYDVASAKLKKRFRAHFGM